MGLITVVVPTHNRLGWLQEALLSVEGQTYQNWEVVVVDDASVDATWEWLAASASPRTRAIRVRTNCGLSAARNIGLDEALGEFVLFLDDDDMLHRRGLERLARALRARPQAVAAVGARLIFDERGQRGRSYHPWLPWHGVVWREVLIGWVGISGQTLFRSEILRAHGGWDAVEPAEDQDLWLRLTPNHEVTFVPAGVLLNRIHAHGHNSARSESVQAEIRQRFVDAADANLRPAAEAVLASRSHLFEALRSYQARKFPMAFRQVWSAARSTPSLVASPLIGPGLVGLMVKVTAGLIVGRRAFDAATRVRRLVLRRLGRFPTVAGLSAKSLQEMDGISSSDSIR